MRFRLPPRRLCARPSARTSVAGAIGAASATQTAKQRRGRRIDERTNERCENLLRPDDGRLIEITPPIIVHAPSTSDADWRRAFSKSVTYYAFVPALAGRSPRRVIWRSLGIWRIGEYLACPPLPPPLSLSLRTTIYRHWITNRFVVN